MRRKKIMLIATEDCNLRCAYCYERQKQRRSMSFETAKRIVDGSFADLSGYEGATLELHGGEPFLNFPLIEQLDEYLQAAYPGLDVLYRSTTNGTLIHGEIQRWLRERKDRYDIMLSLDGNREMHDANRKTVGGQGSFDKIDLGFFSETWEYCPVSMTVNERNLPALAAGTIWIQENGFDCLNAFQWAVDWDLPKNLPILDRELKQLIAYYSENPSRHICLLLNYDLERFLEPVDSSFRYCVYIDDPIECYDAEGKYAPCHGFTSFTLGSEAEAETFSGLSIRDFTYGEENICHGCRLVKLCRTCFAANHHLTGSMQRQSPEICIFNRMCIAASIQIQKNRVRARLPYYAEHRQGILSASDEIESYLRTAF